MDKDEILGVLMFSNPEGSEEEQGTWYQICLCCCLQPWLKEVASHPRPAWCVYGQPCLGGIKPQLGKSDNVQIQEEHFSVGLSSKWFLLPFHPLNYLNRIHPFPWHFCAYCTSALQYKTQTNIKAGKIIWLPHLFRCDFFIFLFYIYNSWSSL